MSDADRPMSPAEETPAPGNGTAPQPPEQPPAPAAADQPPPPAQETPAPGNGTAPQPPEQPPAPAAADQPPPPAEETPAPGNGPAPQPPEQPPAPTALEHPVAQAPVPRADRPRWGLYVGTAVGSALLGALLALAGVALLWTAGVFDQERIRIIEVEIPRYTEYPSGEAFKPAKEGWTSKDSILDPSDPSGLLVPDVSVSPGFAESPDSAAAGAVRAIPSIVSVQSFQESDTPFGTGSGVIISPNGYIVTNEHVVAGADSLKVVTVDGTRYPAELVGADPLMDIAVLEIQADDLAAIEFGAVEGLAVGDPVVAVGNPYGLLGGPSFTTGVISAFDRTLVADYFTGDSLYGLLQTDAPIATGSSGGALLDSEGKLIGITTAAMGLNGLGGGLGFAVPIDLVEGIIDDLIADGEVRHAFLGIQGNTFMDEDEAGVESPGGVEIQVLEDSALGEAGGQDGDVITALDGEPVKTMPVLVARLRNYRAGDTATISVDRGGEAVDLEITFGVHPSYEAQPS